MGVFLLANAKLILPKRYHREGAAYEKPPATVSATQISFLPTPTFLAGNVQIVAVFDEVAQLNVRHKGAMYIHEGPLLPDAETPFNE